MMDTRKMQEELAQAYKYKPLPYLFSIEQRKIYEDNLPDWLKVEKKKRTPLFSKSGLLISTDYERVVIGDYGAFIEISPKQIVNSSLKVKEGQEYRITDRHFSERVKYHWYTTKDNTDTKLYYQQKTVAYADYKVGYWYVSPYEATIERVTKERSV